MTLKKPLGKVRRYIRLTSDYGGQRILDVAEIMRHLLNQFPFAPEQIGKLEPAATSHAPASREDSKGVVFDRSYVFDVFWEYIVEFQNRNHAGLEDRLIHYVNRALETPTNKEESWSKAFKGVCLVAILNFSLSKQKDITSLSDIGW